MVAEYYSQDDCGDIFVRLSKTSENQVRNSLLHSAVLCRNSPFCQDGTWLLACLPNLF